MTINFKYWNTRVVRYPLLALTATAALITVGLKSGFEKGDWAAWMQAVGATVAVAIAIWIPYKQREDAVEADERRRQDDARRIKLAIKDELVALQSKFIGPNVTYLLSLDGENIFDKLLPVKAERFPIFASVIDRLTLIDDDALRSEIISAYEWADAMPTAAELNNRLLHELRDIQAEAHYRNDEFQRDRYNFQLQRLRETRIGLQTICKKAIELVNALIPKL